MTVSLPPGWIDTGKALWPEESPSNKDFYVYENSVKNCEIQNPTKDGLESWSEYPSTAASSMMPPLLPGRFSNNAFRAVIRPSSIPTPSSPNLVIIQGGASSSSPTLAAEASSLVCEEAVAAGSSAEMSVTEVMLRSAVDTMPSAPISASFKNPPMKTTPAWGIGNFIRSTIFGLFVFEIGKSVGSLEFQKPLHVQVSEMTPKEKERLREEAIQYFNKKDRESQQMCWIED